MAENTISVVKEAELRALATEKETAEKCNRLSTETDEKILKAYADAEAENVRDAKVRQERAMKNCESMLSEAGIEAEGEINRLKEAAKSKEKEATKLIFELLL